MFVPLVDSSLVVGGVYSPFVLAQVAVSDMSVSDLLLQVPILGILVVVVWLFLKYMREQENLKAETLKHMGDDCHESQEKANATMESMREHMEADAVVRGKTLAIIERMEKRMDRQGA